MLKDGKNQLSMGNESRKRNGKLILSNSVNGGGKVIVKIPLLYK